MALRIIDRLAMFVVAWFALSNPLAAEEAKPNIQETPTSTSSIDPFTGRVVGNKVRVRLEPTIDSAILEELSPGEMVVVLDEKDGFYGIRPPARLKAFVYRTYVIDDVVEGNRVNVRSEPHLDAPVLVQLNKGDRVDGHVSPINNKWLQVKLPETVHFYVAAEFIERAGDANLIARMEKRREEACEQVDRAYSNCQNELAKPFAEIDLGKACHDLESVIIDYSDISEQCQRAHRLLKENQDAYNRKKIDYLQEQASHASERWNHRCKDLASQMAAQHDHLDLMERCLQNRDTNQLMPPPKPIITEQHSQPEKQIAATTIAHGVNSGISDTTTPWIAKEAVAYGRWQQSHPDASMDDFYTEQALLTMQVRGSIQPYRRLIKTKPGNFLLMDQVDDIPIAFLYSTKVNLEDLVGKTVTLKVAPRPNNNYAFPAYFVLDVAAN